MGVTKIPETYRYTCDLCSVCDDKKTQRAPAKWCDIVMRRYPAGGGPPDPVHEISLICDSCYSDLLGVRMGTSEIRKVDDVEAV